MSIPSNIDFALRAVFRELRIGDGGDPKFFHKDLNPRDQLKWDCLPDDFVAALRLHGYEIVARK